MSVHSTLHGSGVAMLLWFAALAGWVAVLVTLRRGLVGPSREAAVAAHGLTLVLVILHGMVLGHGLLPMITTATGGWWALLVVTGCHPERIVDSPTGGSFPRLGAWLGLVGAVAAIGHWIVVT